MRQYIKLTALSGSLVPAEENLTEEAKAERKIQRIINGDDNEEFGGLPVFEYGNFKKFPLYMPLDLIDSVYGTTQGTVVETEAGNYLVDDDVEDIMTRLISIDYVEVL